MSAFCLKNLVLHRGITAVSSSWGATIGVLSVVRALKVVGHLRIQLFCCLLSGAAAAATSRSLLHALATSSGSTAFRIRLAVLDCSSRLGLGLGLRDALA